MKINTSAVKKRTAERKQTKRLLKESLLNVEPEQPSCLEGGQSATQANERKKDKKQSKAEESTAVNEVDRIEVVKDLDFSPTMVALVFAYVFFLDVLINVDHGAVPAALSDISADLGMDQTKMGVMGSMVFFGLFIGSISASFILYLFQHKTIIWLSLCLNGASLWLFTAKSNFIYMCISRILTGFSQIFITIYIPIYIDAYATQKQKSFLLSWVLVMPPIGVVVGYAMTSYIVLLPNGIWEYPTTHFWFQSFRLQCFISFASAGLIFLIPRKYLNINEVTQMKRAYISQMNSRTNSDSGIKHPGESGGTGSKSPLKVDSKKQETGETGVNLNINKSQNSDESGDFAPARIFEADDSENPNSPLRSPTGDNFERSKSLKDLSSRDSFNLLMKNKPFLWLTLAITVLFFVISGVQMWATFYFQHALGVPPKWSFICFGIVALTSPVSGAIMSGVICNWLGGFYSPMALPFCIFIGFFGTASAWMVPLMSNYVLAIMFLWFLLFVGAIVLPICTGVCFTKIEPELRPRANSIANLFYNLLGYFPSPSLYGLMTYMDGRDDSVWGMAFLMYFSTLMVIFVILAYLTDPNTSLKDIFNYNVKDPFKESQTDDKNSENPDNTAQSLQNSQMLTLNIGLGIADTFAKNDVFENISSYQGPEPISHKDRTEKIDLIDHQALNERIRQSQRGRSRISSMQRTGRSSSVAELQFIRANSGGPEAKEDEEAPPKSKLISSRSNDKMDLVKDL